MLDVVGQSQWSGWGNRIGRRPSPSARLPPPPCPCQLTDVIVRVRYNMHVDLIISPEFLEESRVAADLSVRGEVFRVAKVGRHGHGLGLRAVAGAAHTHTGAAQCEDDEEWQSHCGAV